MLVSSAQTSGHKKQNSLDDGTELKDNSAMSPKKNFSAGVTECSTQCWSSTKKSSSAHLQNDTKDEHPSTLGASQVTTADVPDVLFATHGIMPQNTTHTGTPPSHIPIFHWDDSNKRVHQYTDALSFLVPPPPPLPYADSTHAQDTQQNVKKEAGKNISSNPNASEKHACFDFIDPAVVEVGTVCKPSVYPPSYSTDQPQQSQQRVSFDTSQNNSTQQTYLPTRGGEYDKGPLQSSYQTTCYLPSSLDPILQHYRCSLETTNTHNDYNPSGGQLKPKHYQQCNALMEEPRHPSTDSTHALSNMLQRNISLDDDHHDHVDILSRLHETFCHSDTNPYQSPTTGGHQQHMNPRTNHAISSSSYLQDYPTTCPSVKKGLEHSIPKQQALFKEGSSHPQGVAPASEVFPKSFMDALRIKKTDDHKQEVSSSVCHTAFNQMRPNFQTQENQGIFQEKDHLDFESGQTGYEKTHRPLTTDDAHTESTKDSVAAHLPLYIFLDASAFSEMRKLQKVSVCTGVSHLGCYSTLS